MFNPFKKEEPKDINKILKQFKLLQKEVGEISKGLENLEKTSKLFIQRVGIVRYNPFSGVGSDQSFSIALLDNGKNGVVVTSLYGREGNRIYAKPVSSGASEYILSEEEKKAIEKAMS